MGVPYAGELGIASGFAWALLVNYQMFRPWYRNPWLHLTGMTVGYGLMHLASDFSDRQLEKIIRTYEQKGYQIPEDRKALFIKPAAEA